MHFCVQNSKQKQEIMYTNFLQKAASSQISQVLNPNELNSEELQLLEKQPTQRGPKQDSPSRLSGISANINQTKRLLEERVSSTMPDSVKCTLHTRREVKQDALVNSVLFRFTKGLSLRNTTPLGTPRLFKCSFFSNGFSSFIYTFRLQVRIY